MPEVIDGVTYPTTPVIPASTNTPVGGNRPYPTAASPGKAFWQLLKRAMDELDKFESGPIRTLTDAVAALDGKVAVSGQVAGRRFTTTLTQMTATSLGTLNGGIHQRVGGWTPDTLAGDDGDYVSDANYKGNALIDATGIVTIKRAGIYQVTFGAFVAVSTRQRYGIRRNSVTVAKAVTPFDANDTPYATLTLTMRCAVNDTIDLITQGSVDSLVSANAKTGNNSESWVNGNSRPIFQVIRLSA